MRAFLWFATPHDDSITARLSFGFTCASVGFILGGLFGGLL